jgi:hypothetical protein
MRIWQNHVLVKWQDTLPTVLFVGISLLLMDSGIIRNKMKGTLSCEKLIAAVELSTAIVMQMMNIWLFENL